MPELNKFNTMRSILSKAAYTGNRIDANIDPHDVLNCKVEFVFHAVPKPGWGSLLSGEYNLKVSRIEINDTEELKLIIHLTRG